MYTTDNLDKSLEIKLLLRQNMYTSKDRLNELKSIIEQTELVTVSEIDPVSLSFKINSEKKTDKDISDIVLNALITFFTNNKPGIINALGSENYYIATDRSFIYFLFSIFPINSDIHIIRL